MVQEADGNGNGDGGAKKRPRAVETVGVKLIHRDGDAVLVEWLDREGYHRATVPADKIAGNACDQETLAAGVPWGERWSDVAGVSKALEQELYRQGLWTKTEFLSGSHRARAAIQQTLVVPVLESLLAMCREV